MDACPAKLPTGLALLAVLLAGGQTLASAGPDRAQPVLESASQGDPNPQAKTPDDAPASQGDVAVSPSGTVEMHVADQPLGDILRLLSIQGKRNIVATPSVEGRVTADLYGVTFEQALDAVLMANQAGYVQRGNFIYVYTDEEMARMSEARHPVETRVIRLYYITSTDAHAVIEPLLSDVGTVTVSPTAEAGISPDSGNAGADHNAAIPYLVVRDYPERLAQMQRILDQVDARPQQVLVEATILRATLNDDNALGIDFTILGGVDLEMLGATSTGITTLETGQLPTARFERFNAAVETDFANAVPNGGISFGVIKDHVGIFLRALEQVSDTELLANPKVLCLNKQKGQVIVGRRDGYLTTTVTETQAVQTVEFLETGTQLIFRPFIGKNGYVRMELHPEDSIGGLTAANLPFETTTELTTNVQCRDGQTILIGGLFREVNSDSRSQVPLLGDLPGIGQAFRSNADNSKSEEVIILLTVHIVKDDDAYAAASEQQMQDFERMRVGLRHGLMWHGRQRLAQTHYRHALQHYADGDVKKALWNVRLALRNFGQFGPAIKLKEELLDARDWDEDNSLVRDFLWREIQREKGPGAGAHRYDRPGFEPLPVFDRPAESAPGDDLDLKERETDR